MNVSLTVADYLGGATFAPEDFVTLADTGASIAGLTPTQISGLATANVDTRWF